MNKNLSLIVAAGKGCFTCCKGCYQYFGKDLIPSKDLLKFISDYKNVFGLEKITLAGGDPMTRKDIEYLVDELYKLDLKISMDTVGKNFISDAKMVFNGMGNCQHVEPEKLKNKISKIGIPLDGCTTEQLNYFRQMITIDETKEIIKILNESMFNICINTVVNKNNVNSLKAIFDIINQFENVSEWQLFQYSPLGKLGYANRNLFEIEDNEFNQKVEEIKGLAKNSGIKITGKSNSYRKMNYILINSDGEVWLPKYNLTNKNFNKEDKTPEYLIIGTIYELDIFNKIAKICKVLQN